MYILKTFSSLDPISDMEILQDVIQGSKKLFTIISNFKTLKREFSETQMFKNCWTKLSCGNETVLNLNWLNRTNVYFP